MNQNLNMVSFQKENSKNLIFFNTKIHSVQVLRDTEDNDECHL